MSKLIYRYLPVLAFMWLCIALPVGVAPYTEGVISFKGLAVGLVGGVFPAWVLMALALIPMLTSESKSCRVMSYTLMAVFGATVWMLCYTEFFIGYALGCRLNEAVLALVRQTDSSETAEFLNYAFGLKGTWQALAFSLLPFCAALAAIVLKKILSAETWRRLRWCRVCLVVGPGVVFVFAQFISLKPNWGGRFASGQSFAVTAVQFIKASQALDDNSVILPRIKRANELANVENCDTVAGRTPIIVYVIGESANKRHSSLYGYPLDTDSSIATLKDRRGELLVFTDVVTGDCTTNLVMKRLLSTNLDSMQWDDRPLLPAVLRKGGCEVEYFDNQSTPYTCSTVDYSSVYFINEPDISKQCFDYRNADRYEFDGRLVDTFLPRLAMSSDKTKVAIFHLMGQHLKASKRYPADHSRYRLEDYAFRPELNDAEKEDMMHYDNATAYISEQIVKIADSVEGRAAIVIYLPDHGEEIYDWRHQYGRTQEAMTAERAKALYEIPMVVYMTPEYIEEFPVEAESLKKNVDKPFHSYYMPDLILNLAGVCGDMADRAKSPASPAYIPPTNRKIFNETMNYDAIVKD